MARQHPTDDLTLGAGAPAVDQPDLAKPTRHRGIQVLRDDGGHVTRSEGVQIESVLDRDGNGRVVLAHARRASVRRDRKSTRLNSSHSQISYAVFCLKK